MNAPLSCTDKPFYAYYKDGREKALTLLEANEALGDRNVDYIENSGDICPLCVHACSLCRRYKTEALT